MKDEKEIKSQLRAINDQMDTLNGHTPYPNDTMHDLFGWSQALRWVLNESQSEQMEGENE